MIEKWVGLLGGAWVIVEDGLRTKARLTESLTAWRQWMPDQRFRGRVRGKIYE
jgi:hypothetical protein